LVILYLLLIDALIEHFGRLLAQNSYK